MDALIETTLLLLHLLLLLLLLLPLLPRTPRNHLEGFHMSQTAFIKNIAVKYGQSEVKPSALPVQKGFRALADLCPKTKEEKQDMACIPYQSTIGSLLYIALGTRPDIAYAVCTLARYSQNPGHVHWAGVKSIIRYLLHTADKGLFYQGNLPDMAKINFSPSGFSDALFNNSDNGHSTISFVMLVGQHPVSWKSKVSTPVPQSVFKVEWLALNTLSCELIWL